MANEYVVTGVAAEVLATPAPTATQIVASSFSVEVLRTISLYVPPTPRRGQTTNVN